MISEPICFVQGIPCYLSQQTDSIYNDAVNLDIYLDRVVSLLKHTSVFENLILNSLSAGSNVLSIGEGTGEFICSLALKYPTINFFGFDPDVGRIKIALGLQTHFNINNLNLFIGSADWIPFPKDFFNAVLERGVFHILPYDLKIRNLIEIERVCAGKVLMTHLTNARLYMAIRWLQSIIYRNKQAWVDAKFTYEVIEKKYNSVRKLAELILKTTRHKPIVIYPFRGCTENISSHRISLKIRYLGDLFYSTND